MVDPFLSLLLAYLKLAEMDEEYPGLSMALLDGMLRPLVEHPMGGIKAVFLARLLVTPNPEVIQFILGFLGYATSVGILPRED